MDVGFVFPLPFWSFLIDLASIAFSTPAWPRNTIFGSWSKFSKFEGDSKLGTSVTMTGMLLTTADKFLPIKAEALDSSNITVDCKVNHENELFYSFIVVKNEIAWKIFMTSVKIRLLILPGIKRPLFGADWVGLFEIVSSIPSNVNKISGLPQWAHFYRSTTKRGNNDIHSDRLYIIFVVTEVIVDPVVESCDAIAVVCVVNVVTRVERNGQKLLRRFSQVWVDKDRASNARPVGKRVYNKNKKLLRFRFNIYFFAKIVFCTSKTCHPWATDKKVSWLLVWVLVCDF